MNVLEQIEGGPSERAHRRRCPPTWACPVQIIPGCEGAGDNGRLQNTPRVPAGSPAGTAPSCSGPQGNFIRDVALESGERDRNFTGTLSETFSCIAQLGIKGCGFEQPLEAAHRALNNTNIENAMFLRPDAFLAIILITDEDDCSAKSPQLFDPNQDSIESQLGFLQSYRCYEFGIRCDGQRLDRTPKSYENCEPLTGDDALLQDPNFYADFFKGLKDNPNKVIVAAITGNPGPVTTELVANKKCPETDPKCLPAMKPSCVSRQWRRRPVGAHHGVPRPVPQPVLRSQRSATRTWPRRSPRRLSFWPA